MAVFDLARSPDRLRMGRRDDGVGVRRQKPEQFVAGVDRTAVVSGLCAALLCAFSVSLSSDMRPLAADSCPPSVVMCWPRSESAAAPAARSALAVLLSSGSEPAHLGFRLCELRLERAGVGAE